MAMVFNLIFSFIISYPTSTFAGFFDHHAQGWHWYQNQVLEESEEDKKEVLEETAQHLKAKKSDPNEVMKAYRFEIERKLNLALINPTPFNVRQYQIIQKDLMNRSERFAKTWQQTILETPTLDYSVQFPTSQIARHVYLDEQRKDKIEKIKLLSKNYGLFFFFKGKCPYCHTFAPIVKRFSEAYGWDVLAISLDDSQLDEFPESRLDKGQAAQMGVEVVPSLFAVNPQTGHILPLSHGMTTQDEIEKHILVLTEEQ